MNIKNQHTFNQSTKNRAYYRMFCALLLSTFILVATIGCSKNDDDTQSYIQLSNPSATLKQKNNITRKTDTPAITSLIITVTDTNDNQITQLETIGAADTIKLSVPSYTPLIISANASTNGEGKYFGEVTIAAVRPGIVSPISLVLYDINTTGGTPLSVEFPIESPAPTSKSKGMSFSRDNRFVLFFSDDTSLADNGATNLFIRNFSDTEGENTVTNLHTDSAGKAANGGNATEADISADGMYVVFTSTATDLVLNDTNDASDVFLKNTKTGEIQRISTPKNGMSQTGLNSYNPQISDDGNTITFYSDESITENTANTIFVYNRLLKDTLALSIAGISDNYRISGDGKVIAYQAKKQTKNQLMLTTFIDPNIAMAGEMIPQEVNHETSIELQEISISNGNYKFSLSQNGQYTVFIPSEDTTEGLLKDQVYLYNRVTRTRTLLSKSRTNTPFKGDLTQSGVPSLSNDSRYIVFSYDNIIYIRNIEFDNLLEIGSGNNPLISPDGDKIAYEEDDKLFVVENPLYLLSSAPPQKAAAPDEVLLSNSEFGIELSWKPVPDTSFYRIYQSSTPDIAANFDAPFFSPVIYETSKNTTIGLYDFMVQGDYYFYFVVVAVNENGESAMSQEVTNTVPPEKLFITSNIDSTTPISTYQEIRLFFSEEIDTATLSGALNITDSNGDPLFISAQSTSTSAVIKFPPTLSATESQPYTLTISTNLRALTGEPLDNEYAITFNTGLFFNEGSQNAPLTIPNKYIGVVSQGKSYYSLSIPPMPNIESPIFAIKLNSLSEETSVILNVSNIEGATINCTYDKLCILENTVSASEITIIVDGGETYEGAAFSIIINDVFTGHEKPVVQNLSVTMGEKFGYALLKNLDPGSQYYLVDTTVVTGYTTYLIKPSNSVAGPCNIIMGSEVNDSTQCSFTASMAGDILLEFDSAVGAQFNKITRSYQLERAIEIQYIPFNEGNDTFVYDERFVTISNLKANAKYSLSLYIGMDTRSYNVSSNANFTDSICQGTLNDATNASANCSINLPVDGSLYIQLDDLTTPIEGNSISIFIYEPGA